MAEYIDRDALAKRFEAMGLGEHGLVERIFADGVYSVISAFPASDVAPVRHGRWVNRDEHIYCSECKAEKPTYAGEFKLADREVRFCYFCGAKMDRDDNNETD